MNKKAIILYTILRLVVGAAVLLILFAIIFNISMIFLTPEVSQGTSASFNNLVITANRLVAKDPDLKSTIVQYDIDDPFVLFGFDGATLSETCAKDEIIVRPIGKPPQGCDNKPCFCICDEDDNCKKPVECRLVNETIKTIRIKKDISEHSAGAEIGGKQYVAIFGDCGTRGDEWEVKALKLEFNHQSGELLIST